jgi:hypothetical protein
MESKNMDRTSKVLGSVLAILVVILLGVGVYWFATGRSFLGALSPFPTKEDQLKIVIERPSIPENLTITNKSGIRLKVLLFNAGDTVRLAPRAVWTLDPGASAQYPRDNYRFKIFKPAIVDQLLAESGVIGSNVTFYGGEGKIDVSGSPKKPVTFTNNTDESIKIGVFKNDDKALIVPMGHWTIGTGGRSIEWPDAPPEFTVRVYRPQFMDKILATESNVRDQSDIIIKPLKP